ncbi:hypothetical protein L1987_69187 [Smallanthus sonchifolius]|uniref:Uncharacterized protein n=1 Tax=Smallanthus sonchifolius TaxID=185202 RepID=A0ACB9B5N5_9ASTR|nr:hypothetical protein L1987_69187 [Smallanthus sonchifolius]
MTKSDSSDAPSQAHPRRLTKVTLPESSSKRKRQATSSEYEPDSDPDVATERRRRESINKQRGDRPYQAILHEVEVSAQRLARVTTVSNDSTFTSLSQQLYRRQWRRPRVTPDVATTTITEEVHVIVSLTVQSVQVAVKTPILTESVTITPTTIQTSTIPTSIPTTTRQHISEPFPKLDFTYGFDFDEIFTFPTHQAKASSSREPDPRDTRITTLETQVASLLEMLRKSREESDKQQRQINSLIDEVAALKKQWAADKKQCFEHDTMVKLVCDMAKTLAAQGESLKELLEKQPPKPSSEEACHLVDLTKGDDQEKDPEAGPSGSEQQSLDLAIIPISTMSMAEGESTQNEGGGDASGGSKGKSVADVLKDLSDDASNDVILFLEPDYSKEAHIEALCNLEEGEIDYSDDWDEEDDDVVIEVPKGDGEGEYEFEDEEIFEVASFENHLDTGSVEPTSTVEVSTEASPADPTPMDPEAQKDKHMAASSLKDPAPDWQKTSII